LVDAPEKGDWYIGRSTSSSECVLAVGAAAEGVLMPGRGVCVAGRWDQEWAVKCRDPSRYFFVTDTQGARAIFIFIFLSLLGMVLGL
jgi:hypothetical protein